MCSRYKVILTKSTLNIVKTVGLSENYINTIIMKMIHLNDTKIFDEKFRNINCHFLFGNVVSLSCDIYSMRSHIQLFFVF